MNVIDGKFNQSEFKKALEAVKEEMEDHIEYLKILAKFQREKYNACIEEGFTPEEALILCQQVI